MWFGTNPMPRICGECIESWHKVLPSDWSFQFWNEDNYDVEINNFVLQAYSSGNYAFVSDYARWDILHRQGGVYVDTDVFLLKDITPLLSNKAFGGQNCSGVFASGLILGAESRRTADEDRAAASVLVRALQARGILFHRRHVPPY